MKRLFKYFGIAALSLVAASCVRDIAVEEPANLPAEHRYALSFDVSTKTAFDDSSVGKRRPTWVEGDQIYYYTYQKALANTAVTITDGVGYINVTLNGPKDRYLNAFYSGSANAANSDNPIDNQVLGETSFAVSGVALDEQCYSSFGEAHACAAHLMNLNHTAIHFHSVVSIFKFIPDDPSVTRVVFSTRNENKIITGGPYGLVNIEMDSDGNLVSVLPAETGTYGGKDSVVISTKNLTASDVVYFSVLPTYFKNGFKLRCYNDTQLLKEAEYKSAVKAGMQPGSNGDEICGPSVIGLGKVSQWKTGEEPVPVKYVSSLTLSTDKSVSTDFHPGDVAYLEATVAPGDADDVTVTFSNSNAGAVTVERINDVSANPARFKITAVSVGNATVTIETNGNTEAGQTITKTLAVSVSEVPVELPEDLSAAETANCYIAAETGKQYRFRADVKGNSSESITVANDPATVPAYATVLWETRTKKSSTDASTLTTGSIITDVNYVKYDNKDYITFTSVAYGNALIALMNSSGTVLWSWHIWVWPGFDPETNSQTYLRNAGTLMDRNLGAANTFPTGIYDWSTWGLMYQWGRKDPFFGRETTVLALGPNVGAVPAPETTDANKGTVAYTVANPMTYLLQSTANTTGDWHYAKRDNTLWSETKTMYDPCPPGWKVPNSNFWAAASGKSTTQSYNISDLYPGLDFVVRDNDGNITTYLLAQYYHVFYPVQGAWLGVADYSYPKIVYGKTYYGYYWTSGTPVTGTGAVVMALNRTQKTMNPKATDSRAGAFSIRCMKDSNSSSGSGGSGSGGNEGGSGSGGNEGGSGSGGNEGGGQTTPDPVPVTKVTVKPSTKDIFVGNTFQLSYSIEPSNADSTKVTWSTSDASIATVDEKSGLVRGIKVGGPVTITATATDESGKFGICLVTVLEQNSIDLGATSNGTANSYIVSAAGDYCFKPIRGNSKDQVDILEPKSAGLLWQSYCTDEAVGTAIITDVEYSEGSIFFKVPTAVKNGNAVIAAYNSNNEIIWSWHIWVCKDYDPVASQQVYVEHTPVYKVDDKGERVKDEYGFDIIEGFTPNSAKVVATVMDRNLGALSAKSGDVGALGLMYQWGRKDPFLGSGVKNNTTANNGTQAFAVSSPSNWNKVTEAQLLNYTIAHPTSFIAVSSQHWLKGTDNGLWNADSKTIYDPCPPGWMVPKGGDGGIWAKAFGTTVAAEESNWSAYPQYGVAYSSFTASGTVWVPYAGYIAAQSFTLAAVGGQLYLWSATSQENSSYRAYALSQSSAPAVTVSAPIPKAQGNSVRCVKEQAKQ